MPFKSDKQRRYLWSQKPEVAKKFAKYHQTGGNVDYSGLAAQRNMELDQEALAAHNKLRALHSEQPGLFGNVFSKDIPATPDPINTVQQGVLMPGIQQSAAIPYNQQGNYTQKSRDQLNYLEEQAANNALLAQKAAEQGFKFNEGGPVPMPEGNLKKVIQKDRYGNQVTMEYESDTKPLDPTAIVKAQMEQMNESSMMPEVPEITMIDHPGEPKGTDTVPAWLTPGEFVVNAEATEMFGPQIKQMNDIGREMQKGGNVSYKQLGGLQESYASNFQYVPPVDTQQWWDQQSLDAIERAIPDPIKKALIIADTLNKGEISAKKSWSFQEGGDVPMPQSYLKTLLEEREGYNPEVYLDSLGKPTVGHGHLLGKEYKDQVGTKPFSKEELDKFFDMDIETATKAAKKNIKNFDTLNKKQQAALISMAFQLGGTGQAKFEKMINAIESGDNTEAAKQALDSLWAQQTPKRAKDIEAAFMKKGGKIGDMAQYYAWGDQVVGSLLDRVGNLWDYAGGASQTGATGGHTGLIDTANQILPLIVGDSSDAVADHEAWRKRQNIRKQLGVPDVAEGYIPPPDPGLGEGQPTEQTIPTHLQREPTSYRPFDDSGYEAGLDTDPIQTEEAENVLSEGQETGFDPAWWQGDQYKYGESPGTIPSQVGTEGSEVFEEALDVDTDETISKKQQEDNLKAAEEATNNEPGPGSNQPGDNKSTAEVEEAGENASPEQKKEAMESIKSFADEWGISELFDKKELGKMAVMYLGSRLFGYGHEGSANWAMKNYLQNTTAKRATVDNFIKSNAKNYTPESLQAFKKTGDYSVLRDVKAPVNATGDFKAFYKGGKEYQAQKYKVGDGYKWSADGGKSFIDTSYHTDASRVKGTKQYSERLKSEETTAREILKEIQGRFDEQKGGQGLPSTYRTNISPAKGAREISEWAIENDIDPSRVATLADQAYRDAINSATGDRKPSSLKPFLNSLVIREHTGTPALFITNEKDVNKGKEPIYVAPEKMSVVNRNILRAAGLPDDLKNPTNIDKLNQFWSLAQSKWNELDKDARKQYNRSAGPGTTGFYNYANTVLQEYL